MKNDFDRKLDLVGSRLDELLHQEKLTPQHDIALPPFSLSKTISVETSKHDSLILYQGEYEKSVIKETISGFHKYLLSQNLPFVRIHKSILINTRKIRAISRLADGDYSITLEGLSKPKIMTRYYAKNFCDFMGMEQIDFLEPYNHKAEKIRSLGLYSFGKEEVLHLDITSDLQKKRFLEKYAIHRFSRKKLEQYFLVPYSQKLDKPRIIRNIIFQIWNWIEWGIIEKFTGSIRSIWYKYVSFVLKNHEDLKASTHIADEAAVYDYFNDFVEFGFFTYRDFGFRDPNLSTRHISSVHPQILLFAEKSSLLSLTSQIATLHSVSWLITRGQVPWITAEYMTDEMKNYLDPQQEITVFTLTDLNPGGKSIGENLKKRFSFYGFENVKIIPVIDSTLFTDKDIEDFRNPLVSWREKKTGSKIVHIPVSLRDKRLYPAYYEWFFGSQSSPGINDPRLITRKPHKKYGTLVTLYGLDADILDHSTIQTRLISLLPEPDRSRLDIPDQTRLQLLTILNTPDQTPTQKLTHLHQLLSPLPPKSQKF